MSPWPATRGRYGGRRQGDRVMTSQPQLVVFRRPGCGYCMRLERALDAADIAYRHRDIWEDDEAAAFVRSVNHGAETVPTVVLAGEVIVNPEPATLLALIDALTA